MLDVLFLVCYYIHESVYENINLVVSLQFFSLLILVPYLLNFKSQRYCIMAIKRSLPNLAKKWLELIYVFAHFWYVLLRELGYKFSFFTLYS